MPAFAPGEARGLIRLIPLFRVCDEARGNCRGLLSSAALATLVASTGCAPKEPHAVAVAADAKSKLGIYEWLADHDPSAVLVVGLDPATVRAVAPNARVLAGSSAASGCARARREHALLADLAPARTPERDRADDCGYALYRDDGSVVVAPR